MRRKPLPGRFSLKELLSRARRLELTRLIADKSLLAAAVLMGGLVVLLLAGTQVLDWYWPVLLTLISLAAGLYRLRKNIPSLYSLAQRIDRRLKLADALSTAFHFSEHPDPTRQAVCERQARDAEEMARRIDLRQALPGRRPRYAAPAAVLAAVAMTLFGVRYLATGNLSLQPSLVRLAYDMFFGPKTEAQNRPPRARLDPRNGGDSPDKAGKQDTPPDDLLDNPDNPDNPAAENSQDQGQGTPQDQTDSKADKAKQDPNPKQDDRAKQGNDPADQNSQQDSKNPDQNGDNKPSNSANSSMMDKLRDALSSMMNKMKPQSQDGKQQEKNSQQGQQGDRPDQGQKGQQSKEQAQDNSNADTQGDQNDQQDANDSKSNQSSDKNPTENAQNGAGVKNGDKALREAEQLAAMGKITEILGKRQANITGEMMVEVGSSKQQIKTPWAQKQVTHSEAGGEIHRDEVPLMYQPFVEQYFEEIRKTAPAKPDAGKAPRKTGPAGAGN